METRTSFIIEQPGEHLMSKTFVSSLFITLYAGHTFAASQQTTLGELLAGGFEIKGYTMGSIALQKGKEAYVCDFGKAQGMDPNNWRSIPQFNTTPCYSLDNPS